MSPDKPTCNHGEHGHVQRQSPRPSMAALERASLLFRAMGDPARLRTLEILLQGECCVTELVEELHEKFSTVSQRLRLLRTEGLIRRRREGSHIFYALTDRHVADLIQNALAHAAELSAAEPGAEEHAPRKGVSTMSHQHANHDHKHGPSCGHTGVKHDGHVDYLHDGHLHHMSGAGVEEHALAVDATNPAGCTPKHSCGAHDKTHRHGPGCGHEAVPHGDHVDYLVNGHLHHVHGDHCDDHGPVSVVK